MGGLRPGRYYKPMPEHAKADTRNHWRHVHEASGQPFDYTFFDRRGFIYDTGPAARAVVVAQRRSPDFALAYLIHVQEAFYAQNQDVTDPEVLADRATDLGLFDRAEFLSAISAEETKKETWQDYAISQGAGVTGFPTLIAGPNADGTYALVTHGFQTAEVVLPLVERWFELKLAS